MGNTALGAALAQTFASDDVLRDEPMRKHTTFRCGGPADYLVRAADAADITSAISAAKDAGEPWWVIGCGSDLLVSDSGLRGVVVEVGQRMAGIAIDGTTVRAQAGATNEAVAQAALEAALPATSSPAGSPAPSAGRPS